MKPRHAGPEPCKVLLVEDEFLIAMELVGLLEGAGYEVIGPAMTVEDALALLDRCRPGACVLDVNLRGKRSTPVAAALKTQEVPFVVSSAYERATLDEDPIFHDVVNIGKPAPAGRLLAALASLLNPS